MIDREAARIEASKMVDHAIATRLTLEKMDAWADRIVDAALGDRPLYRQVRDVGDPRRKTDILGWFAQAYPGNERTET